MRPMGEGLIVVFLVGCLVTAMAVAGEQEGKKDAEILCNGPYKRRTLTAKELTTILHNHQAWLKSEGEPLNERRANLCQAYLDFAGLRGAHLEKAILIGAHLFGADLRKAVLREAHLEEAILIGAHLQGAILHGAYLQEAMLIRSRLKGADLREAHLQRAHLFEANLQKAILMETHLENTKFLEAYMARADLQRAYLKGTDLQKAHLDSVNLAGAIYEPNPESLPLLWTLTSPANNLAKLVFYTTPAALVALREAFKKAGMRTQERQITYAIGRNKMLLAWDPSWHTPGAEDMRPWLEKLSGKSESLFSYVWFELPSHYGMAPGRALWGLLGLIPIFALPYWMAIKHANRRSGLWMIVAEDRLASRSGKQKAVQLRPPMAKTWRNRLRGESRMLRTGLYFSLLSAFHLGWREFNVGTWITRMQPREYTLRATGWVRTVSGIQSLLSVYLLALWVLTYFGRPFE